MMGSRDDMLSLTFRDVSACFSEEEWKLLHEWQKELYKNVMEEIHQALISLGHRIINLDTLLQIKKREELNFRDPLYTGIRADIIDPPSLCNVAVTPDILLRIKQDEKPHRRDRSGSKEIELSSSPVTGLPTATSSLLRTKEEQEPMPIDKQERGSITVSKTDDPVITSVFSLNLEHEEEMCLQKSPDPEEIAFDNPVITSVFSLNIKYEEETPFEKESELEGRTTGKPVFTPAYSRSVKLEEGTHVKEEPMTEGETASDADKRTYEDSVKYTKNAGLCKDASEKDKLAVLQSSQEKTNCGSSLWSGSTRELAGNKPTFSKSSSGYPTHQATPKVERSNTYNEFDSNLSSLNFFAWQPDTQQMWRPYKCTECETYFSLSEDLFSHEQIHTGEGPYQCKACDKSFSLKEDFTAHQKTHTKHPVMNMRTEQPAMACIQKETLPGDTKPQVKTYSYTYQCTKCEKSFMLKESLKIHLKTHMELEIRPHQCTMCEKSFNQKEILIRHQRTHSEEKAYTCTECRMKFTHLVGLLTHQKRQTCKRPYQSIIYKQCFVQLGDRITCQGGTKADENKKSNLKTIAHTQKPFQCTECTECFSRRVGLIRHQRSHVENK